MGTFKTPRFHPKFNDPPTTVVSKQNVKNNVKRFYFNNLDTKCL